MDDDTRDLTILRLHCDSMSDGQIARTLKTSRQRVTARRRQIIIEDCLTDPSAAAYWRKHKENQT